jgi:hypothetical protein
MSAGSRFCLKRDRVRCRRRAASNPVLLNLVPYCENRVGWSAPLIQPGSSPHSHPGEAALLYGRPQLDRNATFRRVRNGEERSTLSILKLGCSGILEYRAAALTVSKRSLAFMGFAFNSSLKAPRHYLDARSERMGRTLLFERGGAGPELPPSSPVRPLFYAIRCARAVLAARRAALSTALVGCCQPAIYLWLSASQEAN